MSRSRKPKSEKCYRDVVDMRPWGGESRTGNPRNHRYLLECGHIQFEFHARRWAIKQMAWDFSHRPGAPGTPGRLKLDKSKAKR